MKQYVLGFCFNTDGTRVVLIRKNKPEWQAGFLNGVGGKLEHSDPTIFGAMAREFAEETGVQTNGFDWQYYCRMYNHAFEVYCFYLFADEAAYAAKTTEGEEVQLIATESVTVRQDMISNIPWLITAALDRGHGSNGDDGHTKMFLDVKYDLPGA